MNPDYLILFGAVVFLALVFTAAGITRRSLLALTPDEKALLVDAAANTRLGWFMAAVVLAGAWLAVVLYRPQASVAFAPVVAGLFLVLSAFSSASTYRRYRRIGLPQNFLHDFARSKALRLFGAAAFFATLIAYLWKAIR